MPCLPDWRRAGWILLAWQAIAGLAMLAMAGCGPPAPGPEGLTPAGDERIEKNPQAGPAEAIAPLAEPNDGGQIVEETWDALSIQGNRVGYSHTTVATVTEDGQPLVRTRGATRMVMKRDGQTVTQDILLTSWETAAGELLRFQSRMTTGPGELLSTGLVNSGKLHITTGTLGKTQTQAIPWQSAWGGFFADQQSLRRQPLKPGEQRTLRALQPIINIAAEVQLAAKDYEQVKLPTGEQKLLRVEAVLTLDGKPLETTYWVDEKGNVLKSFVPAIGQEIVRTTREEAMQPGSGAGFDLLVASTVKLKGKLPKPLETRRVVYRARLTSGKIDGIFANCLSQRVKPLDTQTAEITVLAIRPDQPIEPDLAPQQSTDEDLAPNNLIQSDDSLIRQMAIAAAPAGTTWEVARGLERFVAKSIQKKNFSQAFATAAEVARSLEGDCTEHAVLLAALLRARKIPARVAFGLVYYPPQQGFAYHMWTEAWTGDRWTPLDGTLGLGGIGGDHIKLADSSLQGSSAYSAMLPVVQVFNRLELEVLAAE